MPDMEKVIKGLEQCTGPDRDWCGYEPGDNPDCPYSDGPDGCVGYLMRDALEALKGMVKDDAE